MTTFNYLRATKAVTKAEKILGGPLREVLRTKLNEPGINVSIIAQEVNVQKATINYWMARLGINYGRVAHYFDEEVRILSQDEAELFDLLLEMELTPDDLADIDTEGTKTLKRLQELGIPVEELASLTPIQVVALRRLSRMGLTDEQIDLINTEMLETIAKLNRNGISTEDISSLTVEEIQHIQRNREQGITIDDLDEISKDWIDLIRDAKERNIQPQAMAAINPEAIAVIQRAENKGINTDQLDELTTDELALIEKIRQKRKANTEQTEAILGTLDVLIPTATT